MPAFGAWPLASIKADDVRKWHAKKSAETPTLRAHCYGLLRTIIGRARLVGAHVRPPVRLAIHHNGCSHGGAIPASLCSDLTIASAPQRCSRWDAFGESFVECRMFCRCAAATAGRRGWDGPLVGNPRAVFVALQAPESRKSLPRFAVTV